MNLARCLTLAIAALAAGCYVKPAETIPARDVGNAEVKLERLFTHDGCTVYRFYDAGARYYADCPRTTVSWSHTYQCGKTTCSEGREVITPCLAHWLTLGICIAAVVAIWLERRAESRDASRPAASALPGQPVINGAGALLAGVSMITVLFVSGAPMWAAIGFGSVFTAQAYAALRGWK